MCFHNNKPDEINVKFPKWGFTNVCIWAFVERTEVVKFEATHINKCVLSIQQWKNWGA